MIDAGGLDVVTLAERPDLTDRMWAVGPSIWPAFMLEDPVANHYYGRVTADFAHTCLLVFDGDELVVRAFWIPFARDGLAVEDLPDRGWDAIVERGVAAHDAGRTPDAASALEIGIVPTHRGRGLSGLTLQAMRREVRRCGLLDLVAPVRPSGKHHLRDVHVG